MDFNVLGGGIVIAVIVGLWLLYLVPAVMRRRQFDATERNVVRMQQTIRALAETADVPEEMHVKASAQAVVAQKRALKKAEMAARDQVRAATVTALGHETAEFRAHHAALRTRRVSAIFLAATVITVIVGILILSNGGSWETLAIGCAAFAAMIFIHEGVVTATARVLSPEQFAGAYGAYGAGYAGSANRVSNTNAFYDDADYLLATNPRAWAPTPLPRPLHLSEGSVAQAVIASQRAAERLRYATAEAALVERIPVQATPAAIAPATPPATSPAQSAANSHFAQMGVMADLDDTASIDIDQALRRRRSVG